MGSQQRKGSRLKAVREGKKKMNENESLTTYRNRINDFQKRRTSYSLIRHTETYLLVCWSPVLRWHQLFLGLCVELGNHHLDDKLSCDETAELNKARVWGRVVRSSREASVMGVERRDNIFKLSLCENQATNRNYNSRGRKDKC